MNKFYVYMYIDDEDTPIYIGKGFGNRYYLKNHCNPQSNNRLLINKIAKIGVENIKIQFLVKDIKEQDAFYWERYWINYIGRRDKNLGPLCNLTDGGEGISGYKHSDEARVKMLFNSQNKSIDTREKIRSSMKGKKNNLGHHFSHSEETKKKISASLKGRPAYREVKPLSEEQKKKIAQSVKKYYDNRVR